MSDIKMLHLYSCELDAPTREVTLPTPLMHQDAYADEFRIHVTRGGLDLQLDGMTVRAWLYLAATGETMPLKGSADGSMAMVTLEPECYLFPGYATLAIQLQQGEVCRTPIKINLAINRTSSDVVIDPSNVLPTLPELLAQIAAMEQGTAAANAAAEAANTAAANAQEFIITVTTPAYIVDGDMSGIKADKTYAEIQAAINAGKTPVVKLKTSGQAQTKILHLAMIAPYSIVFREHTQEPSTYNVAGSTRCTFLSTGGIIWDAAAFHTVPDNGTEGQVLVKTGDSTYGWRDPEKTAPPIIPTATGSIVTITDGASRPAVEVISRIEPVETGTGEKGPNNPWTISGWDKVTAKQTGRNMVKPSFGTVTTDGITFTANDDSSVTITGTAGSTVGQRISDNAMDVFLKKGYNYHFFLADSAPNAGITLQVYIDGQSKLNSQNGYLTIPETATSAYIRIRVAAGTEVNETIHPMVTLDDNASWETGNAQILATNLSETVYGGTLDWVSGLMTVTHGMIRLDGTQECNSFANNNRARFWLPSGFRAAAYGGGVSERFVYDETVYADSRDKVGFYPRGGSIYVRFGSGASVTTAELATQYFADNPTTFVYKLETPYTIQLTPQQLDTLHGINNVWSDCGDTTLSYIADTELWSKTAATSMIGAAEPSMVASKNYASGDFIVVEDAMALYRATAPIAKGEAIKPGTNCTATTVVEQIATLYSLINR